MRWYKSNGMSVHGKDLYLLKPTLGPPNKLTCLTRVETTRNYPTSNRLCQGHKVPQLVHRTIVMSTAWLIHWRLSLRRTIPVACIVELFREGGFSYLIWIAKNPIQFVIWTNPNWCKPWLNTTYRWCLVISRRQSWYHLSRKPASIPTFPTNSAPSQIWHIRPDLSKGLLQLDCVIIWQPMIYMGVSNLPMKISQHRNSSRSYSWRYT